MSNDQLGNDGSKRSTTVTDALADRQRDEVFALQSIFADEFEDLLKSAEDSGITTPNLIANRPADFRILVRPKRDTGQSFSDVHMWLHVKFSMDYPNVIPEISIENASGIKEEALKTLMQELVALANKQRGHEMCFNLAEHAQDFLFRHMERVFRSLNEEMNYWNQQRNRAVESRQLELTKYEMDENAREYELVEREIRRVHDLHRTKPLSRDEQQQNPDADNGIPSPTSTAAAKRTSSKVRFQDDPEVLSSTTSNTESLTTSVADISPAIDYACKSERTVAKSDFIANANLIRFSTETRRWNLIRLQDGITASLRSSNNHQTLLNIQTTYQTISTDTFCTYSVHEWLFNLSTASRLILQQQQQEQHGTDDNNHATKLTNNKTNAVLNIPSKQNKLRERESLRQLQQVLIRRLDALAVEYRQLAKALHNINTSNNNKKNSAQIIQYHCFDYAVDDAGTDDNKQQHTHLKVRLLSDNILSVAHPPCTVITLMQLVSGSATLQTSFILQVAFNCLQLLSLLHDVQLPYGCMRPECLQILFPLNESDADANNDAADDDECTKDFQVRFAHHALERRVTLLLSIAAQQRFAAVVNLESELNELLQHHLSETRATKKDDVQDLGRLLCWLFATNNFPAAAAEHKKAVVARLYLKYFSTSTTTVEDVFPEVPENLPNRKWADFIDKCLYPDRNVSVDKLVAVLLKHELFNSKQQQNDAVAFAPLTNMKSSNKTSPSVLTGFTNMNTDDDDAAGANTTSDDVTASSSSIIDTLMSSAVESRLQRDFEIMDYIGKGAYGAVVRVRNKLDNRLYAIKQIILPSQHATRYAALQEKMEREVKLLSQLNHENVVRYYNSWLDYVEITRANKSATVLSSSSTSATVATTPTTPSSLFSVISPKHHAATKQHEAANTAAAIHVDVLNSIGIAGYDNVEADAPPMPSYVSGFADDADESSNKTAENQSDDDDEDDDDEDDDDADGKKPDDLFQRPKKQQQLAATTTGGGGGGGGIFENSFVMEFDDDDDESSDDDKEESRSSLSELEEEEAVTPQANQKTAFDMVDEETSTTTTTTTTTTDAAVAAAGAGATTERIRILYIQMEYCEKATLRTLINSGELHRDSERIWRLFREMLDGLAHIHNQGMIHRDLKPDNIFITSLDRVKIGDFGLATNVVQQQQQALEAPDTTSAAAGSDAAPSNNNRRPVLMHSAESMTGRIGTSYYIAPELLKCRASYSYKVDIFSLGVCFFEMCYPPLSTQMERAKILSSLRLGQLPPDILTGGGGDAVSTGGDSASTTHRQQQNQLIKWMCDAEPRKRPSAVEVLQSELMPPAKLEAARAVDWLKQTLHHSNISTFQKIIFMLFARHCSLDKDVTYDMYELYAELVRGALPPVLLQTSPSATLTALPLLTTAAANSNSSIVKQQQLHSSYRRTASFVPAQQQQQNILALEQQYRAALDAFKSQYVMFDNVSCRIEAIFRLFGAMRCEAPLFMPKAKSTAAATVDNKDADNKSAAVKGSMKQQKTPQPQQPQQQNQSAVELMNRGGNIITPAMDARTPFARLVGRVGLTSIKRYALQYVYRESRDRNSAQTYLHPRRLLEAAFDIVVPSSNSNQWSSGAGNSSSGSSDAVICAQAELLALIASVFREFRTLSRQSTTKPQAQTAAANNAAASTVSSAAAGGGSGGSSPLPNSSSSSSLLRRRYLLMSHASVLTALLRECSLPVEKAYVVQDIVLEVYSSHSSSSAVKSCDERKALMEQRLLNAIYATEAEAALDASSCGHFCRLVEMLQNKPLRDIIGLVQREFKRKGQQSAERREAERGIRECLEVVNVAKVMCTAFDEEFLPVYFSVCLSDRNVLTTCSSGGIVFQALIAASPSSSGTTTSAVTASDTANTKPASNRPQRMLSTVDADAERRKISSANTAGGKTKRQTIAKPQIIAAGGRYDHLVEGFRLNRLGTNFLRGAQGCACFGVSFSLDTIVTAELGECDADEFALVASRQANATVVVVNSGRAELAHLELKLVNDFRMHGISSERVTYFSNNVNIHASNSSSSVSYMSEHPASGSDAGGGGDDLSELCRSARPTGSNASCLVFVRLRDTLSARLVHCLPASQRVADRKVPLADVVQRVISDCLVPIANAANFLTQSSTAAVGSGATANIRESSVERTAVNSGGDSYDSNSNSNLSLMLALRGTSAADSNSSASDAVNSYSSASVAGSGAMPRINITFALPGAPPGGSSSNLANKQQRYSARDRRLFQSIILNRLKNVFTLFSSTALLDIVCVDLKEPLLNALVGSLYMTPEGRVQTLDSGGGSASGGGGGSANSRNNKKSGGDALAVEQHTHAKHRAYVESIVSTLREFGENARRRLIIYSLGGEGGVSSAGFGMFRFVP